MNTDRHGSGILDRLPRPIVLAPLAGGPSTPELAAAVTGAGGLGFIAAGYLGAAEVQTRIARARELAPGPFGVNLFVPGSESSEASSVSSYVERLRERGLDVGDPRFSDDEWTAKLEVLERAAPAVVSFTFGCPPAEVIARVQAVGAEAWVTVTAPEEACEARAAGADALVVQGAEAGGHRGSFVDHPDLAPTGLVALLPLVRAAVDLPLVASGGIIDGAGVAAALCLGARAVQLGTAFMLAPEAGTAPAHRAALAAPGDTVLTRAFTGRLARGIRNRFIDDHEAAAPLAYPEVHYVTASLRRAAREAGDPDLINLWAGEAHELARAEPAAEIVKRLTEEARLALAGAGGLLS